MKTISRFLAIAAILILTASLPHRAYAADVFCMADRSIVAEGSEVVIQVFANWNVAALATVKFSASGGAIQRVTPTLPNEAAAARWTALDNRGTFDATVNMTSTNGESASCVVRVAVVGSDYGSPGTEAGRIWLRSAEPEKPGYGAYTYLLFSAPIQATLDRQKMTIQALLRRISDLREMQKQFEKKQLNIVSLPVKDLPKKENDPDAVLTLYDYPHARRLLNTINPGLRAGPYLVTAPEPLESAKKSERIIMDLSGVPPDVVEFWAGAYFDQLAQQGLWGKPFEPPVTLRLRTLAAVVGLAVPDVSSAAERLIKVLGGK
jgi:hypothetical protein